MHFLLLLLLLYSFLWTGHAAHKNGRVTHNTRRALTHIWPRGSSANGTESQRMDIDDTAWPHNARCDPVQFDSRHSPVTSHQPQHHTHTQQPKIQNGKWENNHEAVMICRCIGTNIECHRSSSSQCISDAFTFTSTIITTNTTKMLLTCGHVRRCRSAQFDTKWLKIVRAVFEQKWNANKKNHRRWRKKEKKKWTHNAE